jgi:hypothetical protein
VCFQQGICGHPGAAQGLLVWYNHLEIIGCILFVLKLCVFFADVTCVSTTLFEPVILFLQAI